MTLKDLRKSHAYTQDDLARAIGVKQATIAMWENGKAMPTMKNLISLSEALGETLNACFDAIRETQAR